MYDIIAWVKSYIQPLSRGRIEKDEGDTLKLSDLLPKGSRPNITKTSSYGISFKAPGKGVFAYFLNFLGFTDSSTAVSYHDRKRPVPQKTGEVILYCRKEGEDGTPVRITFDPDGNLLIHSEESVSVSTKIKTVTSDDSTENVKNYKVIATTKIEFDSDDVVVGKGASEKPLNGETATTKYNAHLHFDGLGLPCTTPVEPWVPAEVQSQKVKVAK